MAGLWGAQLQDPAAEQSSCTASVTPAAAQPWAQQAPAGDQPGTHSNGARPSSAQVRSAHTLLGGRLVGPARLAPRRPCATHPGRPGRQQQRAAVCGGPQCGPGPVRPAGGKLSGRHASADVLPRRVLPTAFAWFTPQLYAPALGFLMFSIGVNLKPAAFMHVLERPQVAAQPCREVTAACACAWPGAWPEPGNSAGVPCRSWRLGPPVSGPSSRRWRGRCIALAWCSPEQSCMCV